MRTQKQQILIAESGSGYGGTATYLAGLLPLLDTARSHVELLAHNRSPLIQQIEGWGWRVHHSALWRYPWGEQTLVRAFSSRLGAMLSAVAGLIQLIVMVPLMALWIRSRRYELLHLNNELSSHAVMILAARLAGAKVLCHLHGWRALTRLELWTSRYVQKFISVTEAGADYYAHQLGRKDVLGVPNGLLRTFDHDSKHELRADFRCRLGLTRDEFLVVLIGRFIPLKGHTVLINALAKAKKVVPKIHALFVGRDSVSPGEYEKALRGEISELELQNRIDFMPWQEDLFAIYAASDLVVQPSVRPESFGLVVLEAMAAERPVIASRLGGLVDVVDDGKTGLLFEAGNAEELAAAIIRIAGDPNEAKRMSLAARRRAESEFSMEQNSKQINQIYDELVANPKELEVVTS